VSRSLAAGRLLLGVVALMTTGCLPDQQQDDVSQQVDALFEAAYDSEGPGAAVIVVKGGRTILRKGYGLANLEHGVPITPRTAFRLDAVTGQFTAMAILMLEEEGRLSVTDPITAHLPDYPMSDTPITVGHLLSHTSGIRNYTGMRAFWKRAREDLTVNELVSFFKDAPLDFPPGQRYAYSSSNYVLLGVIIEKASGMKYEEFIAKRIFKPLGMENSYYYRHSDIIPNRAGGYLRREDEFRNASFINTSNLYAAAGLLSTVDDLACWDVALYTDQLVSKGALERYFTAFDVNDGSSSHYAYGWLTEPLQDHPAYMHYGWMSGFICKVIRLPEDSTYVAVLSNIPESDPSVLYLADRAAAIAIGRPFEKRSSITLAPEILDRYVGVYRVDESTLRYVTREGNRLFTQRSGWPRLETRATSETEFFYPNSSSHFEFFLDDDGHVTHMLMHQRGRRERADRTDEPLPAQPQAIDLDPAVFDRYVGEYEFESGYRLAIFRQVRRQRWEERKYGLLLPGVRFTVFRDVDRFMAESGYGPIEIFPQSETKFFLEDHNAELTFVLTDGGTVEGVILRSVRGHAEVGRKVR
jgi:D-alanyl-D-alanine carboxypeptidase